MVSQIQTFYKDKNVFLTGGSGFLGRVIIEKLLRATKVKCIYVLFRPKKGVSIKDRIATWDQDPLFAELIKLNPNYADRVVAISGDCELPDLGISADDRKLLVQEVHIVIHGAATVRFDEKLKLALNINTRGTFLVLQLAKEMSHLESFVHISTGYSNCVICHIAEDYYPNNLESTYDKMLSLNEELSPELIENLTPGFLGKYPNTYTFTKALAEQVVQKEAQGFPAAVFRPGMILATFKEPIPGWTDNLYGPISILYGSIIGVLRVTLVDTSVRAHIVPVDYCANMILSIAWKTAQENVKPQQNATELKAIKEPKIYNYVTSDVNPFIWENFMQGVEAKRYICPLEQMIWYPFIKTYTKRWAFELAIIVYHIIPGHIIDLALRVSGRKPRMMKIYDKIHKSIRSITWFATINWFFEMNNTDSLLEDMSAEDRELFECDMKQLKWDKYFTEALYGIRKYLAKEPATEESFKRARNIMKRFYIYHRLLQTIVCGSLGALSFWLLRLIYRSFY